VKSASEPTDKREGVRMFRMVRARKAGRGGGERWSRVRGGKLVCWDGKRGPDLKRLSDMSFGTLLIKERVGMGGRGLQVRREKGKKKRRLGRERQHGREGNRAGKTEIKTIISKRPRRGKGWY